MIRNLFLVAIGAALLCWASIAGAFAIAGGPFSIREDLGFHHKGFNASISGDNGSSANHPDKQPPPR